MSLKSQIFQKMTELKITLYNSHWFKLGISPAEDIKKPSKPKGESTTASDEATVEDEPTQEVEFTNKLKVKEEEEAAASTPGSPKGKTATPLPVSNFFPEIKPTVLTGEILILSQICKVSWN